MKHLILLLTLLTSCQVDVNRNSKKEFEFICYPYNEIEGSRMIYRDRGQKYILHEYTREDALNKINEMNMVCE